MLSAVKVVNAGQILTLVCFTNVFQSDTVVQNFNVSSRRENFREIVESQRRVWS